MKSLRHYEFSKLLIVPLPRKRSFWFGYRMAYESIRMPIRLGLEGIKKEMRDVENEHKYGAYGYAAALLILYWILALIRLDTGRATTWDFGYYTQVLWLIHEGHWIARSTLNGHWALTDAGSWILYPLGWSYAFLHSSGILLIQAASLASGVPFLAWWMHRYPVPRTAFYGILVLYSVYPAILGPALFDWHPDTLAIPLFFYAAWAIETKRVRHFWLACALIITTKVTAALVLVGLSAPWLLQRQWKVALATGVIGFFTAFFEVDIVFPALTGHQMSQWAPYYGWLGSSPLAGAWHIVVNPWILKSVFQGSHLADIVLLGAFVAFIPSLWGLVHGGWAWPGWIILLFNNLSLFLGQSNPYNQYSLPIAPFWLISLILLWSRLRPRLVMKWIPWGLAVLSMMEWVQWERPLVWFSHPPAQSLMYALSRIPRYVPVYGQNSTLAMISDRKFIHLIPLPPRSRLLPGTVVILNQDVNPVNRLTAPIIVKGTLTRLISDPQHWQIIAHRGPVWAFQLYPPPRSSSSK